MVPRRRVFLVGDTDFSQFESERLGFILVAREYVLVYFLLRVEPLGTVTPIHKFWKLSLRFHLVSCLEYNILLQSSDTLTTLAPDTASLVSSVCILRLRW